MDTAVALVRAYLELCGYFVLTELPVRARAGQAYRDVTDIDILAVRFPYESPPTHRFGETPLHLLMGYDPELGATPDAMDVIVGEVKESQARLNPALRRQENVAFALRRVGCCPEARVEAEASQIVQGGRRAFTMPGGMRCNVRLVVFAGHGSPRRAAHFVPLGHCIALIRQRLRSGSEVFAGAHFKDPVLGFVELEEKLARFDVDGK